MESRQWVQNQGRGGDDEMVAQNEWQSHHLRLLGHVFSRCGSGYGQFSPPADQCSIPGANHAVNKILFKGYQRHVLDDTI